MNRVCPACSEPSIPVSAVLLSDSTCTACGATVGFHWSISLAFAAVITPVAVVSTLLVLLQMGFYAALLWLPFPIGTISYLKARLCPLSAREDDWKSRHAPGT